MIGTRPSVYIYSADGDPDFLREVCAGIEEEGVPYEIFRSGPGAADPANVSRPDAVGTGYPDTADAGCRDAGRPGAAELAFRAANDSMTGAGVGISGVDIALHFKALPENRPVAAIHMPLYRECRMLGSNSARLIKKACLKEQD